jgi:hypothetical protein
MSIGEIVTCSLKKSMGLREAEVQRTEEISRGKKQERVNCREMLRA